ncbi:TolC family protein [Fontimonas sp. SYSU GA230001]|uniref:TolC family protein n=1 Tax=Fontimonas sp. SYSU GA230001 TaxID=3142450 RepID=UPI0032B3F148
MFTPRCRAQARRTIAVLAILPALATAPPTRADDASGIALGLDEAVRLAVTAQPVLDELDAQRRAARESAVSAAQLPDPQLNLAIADLPIDTVDAYSFTGEADTQVQIGLAQEFPRARKRRLRGETLQREARLLDAARELALRSIHRDAALAWIELWRYDRELQLTQASLREATSQMQVAEIALRTASITQAEFLTARQDVHRLADAVRRTEQRIAQARNTLSRWIGDAALRPVCPDLPALPAPPPLEAVLARLDQHPQLIGATARVAAARTGTRLAQSSYAPDWRIELAYSHRTARADTVLLQTGVDLPLFTRDRQDRDVATALAREAAAQSAVDDSRRQLRSEARLNHHDYERLIERLRDYDTYLLPDSGARIDATLAGWRAGRSLFRDLLDARRAHLEVQTDRLDLQHELANRYVQLVYLGAFGLAEGEVGHD